MGTALRQKTKYKYLYQRYSFKRGGCIVVRRRKATGGYNRIKSVSVVKEKNNNNKYIRTKQL